MIKRIYLKKWSKNNDVINFFDNEIESFERQFPDEYIELIEKLLSHYSFYEESTYYKNIEDYIEFINDYCIKNDIEDFCLCLPVVNNYNSKNSHIFTSLLNNSFDVYVALNDTVIKYNNIFIVDDYSGSGITILNFLKNNEDLFKFDSNKRIYISPMIFTDVANEKFNELIKDYSNVYNIGFLERKAKFITKQGVLNSVEKNKLEILSKAYCYKKDCIFGFKDVEDLFSTYFSTPNNTIGIFWDSDEILYKGLFNRGINYKEKLMKNRFISSTLNEIKSYLRPGKRITIKHLITALLLINERNKNEILKIIKLKQSDFTDIKNKLIDSKIIHEYSYGKYEKGLNFKRFFKTGYDKLDIIGKIDDNNKYQERLIKCINR